MPDYVVAHQRPEAFFKHFNRKSELQHQTHYCPGCGHGIAHKLLAHAIDALHIQDRVVLISPVGCSVFAYYYFDVGNVQGAHGRAPAVATAVKRSHPDSIVVSYQGDGDLSAIGSAEILHAANRGENITVFFINNAIYGMTGGQMAPTTLVGQKSTTSPLGRNPLSEGYPLRMCELLNTLEAPVFIERVALAGNKEIAHADKTFRKALENQVKGLGFSFVEVLSPCPTIWKMNPVEAERWVHDEMTKVFPPGVFRDRTATAVPRPAPAAPPPIERIPDILNLSNALSSVAVSETVPADLDLRVKVAGFGGQGVLLLGELLADAGVAAGLEVSWLPSYGPEMRSGTSNCQVRLSRTPIDSPLVSRPTVLVAMNEPSLRKFASSVVPGGWILYNADKLPEGCGRDDVHFLVRPFTGLADELGDAKAGNMVMLGALLEITQVLPESAITAVLSRYVKDARWLDLDCRALALGRQVTKGMLQ